MTDAIREKLGSCYTGVVHDVMRSMGLRNFTLPHQIRPLMPEKTLCGPAFTIEGRPDDTADDHQTLLEWTGLLSRVQSGCIWVCQPHTHDLAQMGELSAETLQKKGVLGCVLDGHARDTNFLVNIGFQTWRRSHTPKDIVGRWLPTGTQVPIQIEDVRIEPGDYLLGEPGRHGPRAPGAGRGDNRKLGDGHGNGKQGSYRDNGGHGPSGSLS